MTGKKNPAYKHGHTSGKFSPEYQSWATMHQRCGNPNTSGYKHYGAKGIKVCPEWADFQQFLRDMGPRPEGMTLDRIDLSGGYNPANCRWADLITQARNSTQVVWVQIGDERKRLVEWCEQIPISINTVRCRVKKHGMSYEEALTTPIQKFPGQVLERRR